MTRGLLPHGAACRGRIGLLAMLVLAGAAWADGPADSRRVADLEKKNRDLERRLERVEERDAERALRAEVEDYVEDGLGLNLVVRRGNVQGIFQMFGDVGFRYDNPEVPGRSNGFFFNGGLDLFFTARAGDHFHVLSETVFLSAFDEPKDDGHFDQERLWGAWRFSDALQVKFGLEHGPISRWNAQFHHGRWLEMAINRPLLANFEGSGGILPMHNAGVEFTGYLRSDAGRFEYFVFVSNGRGRTPTDTHEFSDRNDGKALEVGLGMEPERIQRLWVGVFWRIDDMPPNPTDPARLRSIREMIGSFQVDYRGDPIEILFEFAYIDNRDRQSDTTFGHFSTYLQVAYHLNDRWVLYTRVDVREMELGDPYFMPFDRDLDILEGTLGLRFDFIANASLKFEVGAGEREERNAAGDVATRNYVRLGLQLAWVF